MDSNLILTPAQAQAVYSAMCALNAVGGKLETTVDEVLVRVGVLTGRVSVVSAFDADDRLEIYDDQDAFAAAYGLRQPPDVAALVEALQAALAYNDSVMSADGSGQFSWGPNARAAIAQATA
ncbi:hypothetical protein [Achromobacter xylosoxidans]|uniref:hypothetical protein n=1 Tax=Alcaligenes xylosoxydans xylosoxydans TaxID=85698 RepID=UPI0006C26C7A|nr:hypothetical protein [Achromobacter xylosoxidans]CUJ51746.1 Uncharacterised protein [Achromobacter xylosoxidans]